MTNRTIFVYTTLFSATGGGQYAMSVLAEQLRGRGYKSVFFTRPPFRRDHRYVRWLAQLGISFHVFPRFCDTWWGKSVIAVLVPLLVLPYMLVRRRGVGAAWSAAQSIVRTYLIQREERRVAATLTRCLKAERDRGREVILHIWIPASLAPVLLRWANRENVPAVFHEMGEADEPYFHTWDLGPSVAEMHRASAVVCTCESVAANIRRVYGYKGIITIAPSMVADPGETFERGQKRGGRFTIGIIGRLVAHKRHSELLAAVKTLTGMGYDVGLVIAGHGPMRQPLEDESMRLGIADRVHFTGEFERLEEVMALFDVFAIMSESEGECMPILESGSYAKPVVVANHQGMPDFVEDGVTGLLVPLGNNYALVTALKRLIDDPDLRKRMGDAGRRRYEERYKPDRIADIHEGVYNRLLADRPAAGLNLAYVVEYYATFIIDEIDQLRRLGVKVTLLSAFRPKPEDDPKKDAYRRESLYFPVGYHRVMTANLACLFTRPLAYLRALMLIRRQGASSHMLFLAACFARHVRSDGIGHLHGTFGTRTTALAAAVGLLSRRSFSFTTHAYDIYRPNPSLVEKTNAAAFMRTISAFNKRYIESAYPGVNPQKIKVVYLGVNTTEYVPTPDTPSSKGLVRLVSVGNMVAKKGHVYLIRACAVLARRGYRFTCSIVGEGDNQSLVQEIEKHELGPYVKLLGGLPHKEIGRLLPASDVFVLACIDARDRGEDLDGIPVSLMEAMALSLPVVSTNLSGIPELVEDGVSGLLAPEKDAAALADAIARLCDDAGIREQLGRAARRRIEEKFDLKKNTEALAALFRDAC